ncbi:hypothetical protein [Pacificispira sp.]|uniref:hypothetical protein n=1 Tax=Pacificispira sp. TaxID=2888761 RepID=UPI003B5279CE
MKVVVDGDDNRGWKPGKSTGPSPMHRSIEWYRAFHRFVLSEPALKPIADLYGGGGVMNLSGSDLVRLHTKAVGFFHRLRDPNLTNGFSSVLDTFAQLNPAAQPNKDYTPALTALNDRGYVELPSLPDDRTRTMHAYLDASPLVPSEALRRPESETAPEEAKVLRQNWNLAYVPRSRLLRMPGLLSLAMEPEQLNMIRHYLGAPPILTDISAWRSFAGESGPKEAKDAQLFHFDLDNYRFCKLFVYLTDVDDKAGPHIFVPTTHKSETISAKRPPDGTPEQAAFDQWYFETIRKSEADVRKWFGTEPDAITGPAGTRFIADTKGLHRGCPPTNRDRWVLQFVFGTTPATVWFESQRPRAFADWDGSAFRSSGDLAAYCLSILFPGA